MELLNITADIDDSCVGLTGKVNLHGFSGFGEAWFNLCDITNFCKELKALAANMVGSIELIGAQSKSDGSEYLETFSIRCYVLSASKLNGLIGVHITLADNPYNDCRNEEIRKLSGELQVRNHKIVEFSDSLVKLISGKDIEVVLHGGARI